jgi:hypothetical protein
MVLTKQVVNGPIDEDDLNTSSIPIVTATSDIIAPFAGQLIFNLTDMMVYRYDGGSSSWLAILGGGGTTSAQQHEIRYEQKTAAQSVPTSTDTKMKFETIWNSCDDVIASGTNNTDFLLTRQGLYVVSCGSRFLGNAGGGERHIWVQFGTTFAAANRIGFQSQGSVAAAPVSVATAFVSRFAANTSICVGLWQNSGVSLTLDTGFGGSMHIAAAWLRP